MNNLVANYADSDDESPRRRSSSMKDDEEVVEERKRRNSEAMFDDDDDDDGVRGESAKNGNFSSDDDDEFAEPPPPKRHADTPSPGNVRTPQNVMPHTSSQASLVSYSGDNDDEPEEKRKIEEDTPQLSEPKPPARVSQDEDTDEEERLIDLALEESKQAISKMNQALSPAGSDTPARESSVENGDLEDKSKAHGDAEPEFAHDDDIRIPAPPEIDVDERLQARFEAAFRQKAMGINLNQQIQSRKDFCNPMSYEQFIDRFDIDEKGTNFPSNIFDPHCIPENCFYDKIGEEQRKLMEAQQTANAKKLAK
ncbi:unnamed protein product [Caenorhabditis bovis]|uniref:SAP30-binding protein n=1 Tax=Caenorhabditis bovis TaxID=2654633 RepID=A0A8S1EJY2_9PELO|nr:unnamed protein product [Caenorhabditis bovis]